MLTFLQKPPRSQEYWDAYNASKQADTTGSVKDFEKAFELYKLYLEENSADQETKNRAAWVLYKWNKALLKLYEGKFVPPKIQTQIKRNLSSLVKRYSTKPGLVNSLALKQAAECDFINFIQFVQFWGLENFRPEDWEPGHGSDGKEYQSIVASSINRVGKVATQDSERPSSELELALRIIEFGLAKVPYEVWWNYYRAKLLSLLGRGEQAKTSWLEVLKNKKDEPWAWDKFADFLTDLGDPGAFAARCRAVSLIKEEEKSRSTRLRLAQEMFKRGFFKEAKCELSSIKRTTEDLNLRPLKGAAELERGDWFKETDANEDNRSFYRKYLQESDNLIVSQVPWQDAVVGNKYSNKMGKLRITILTKELSLVAKPYMGNLIKRRRGEPISVKIINSSDGRSEVFCLKDRRGEDWDCLTKRFGIVTYVDKQKGSFQILFEDFKKSFCLLQDVVSGFEPKAGDSVSAKVAFSSGQNIKVYSCEFSEAELPNLKKEICEPICKINKEKGFGFTESGVFFKLFKEKDKVSEGDLLEGSALRSWDKKKSQWGWAVEGSYQIKSLESKDN